MSGVRLIVLSLLVLFLTSSCLLPSPTAEPTPTPDMPLVIVTTATSTAKPVPSVSAKAEQTAPTRPTLTSTPTATKTPPTATPVIQSTGVDPTPTYTATSTATPAKTSTPNPTPPSNTKAKKQLEVALRLKHNGDYAAAIAQLQATTTSYPETSEAKEAMYQLAHCYLLDYQYDAAFKAFRSFSEAYPDDERNNRITFFLAHCYQGLGLTEKAIENYRQYAAKESALAGYISHDIGDMYKDSENYQQAMNEYQQLIDTGPPAYLEMAIREKIALCYLLMEDYSNAVAGYNTLLPQISAWFERARIQYQIGVSYKRWEQMAEAETAFAKTAIDYPRSNHAYNALAVLDEMKSAAVDDYQRGLIYYYNWAPDEAIASFQRYISSSPQGDYFIAAHYFLGLSHLRQGNNAEAITTLSEFAQSYPTSAFADDALWEAAVTLEELSRFQEAVETYRRLETNYPSSSYVQNSAFHRGLSLYKMSDFRSAEDCWNNLLLNVPDTKQKSTALFWMGKAALRRGETERGRELLGNTASIEPEDYYTYRAHALLTGEEGFSGKPIDISDPYILDAKEKADFETWLATWVSPIPPQFDAEKLDPQISDDPRFQMGEELLAIGLYTYANHEFSRLKNQFWSDPLFMAQLSLFFRNQGLYQHSISCATRLLNLSPATLEQSPVLLQKLLYPTYYGDLVAQESKKVNIDPLILFSMIKQESMFYRYALSSAEARGLSQVIPSTGRGIAQNLGKGDFRLTDLYRPVVSIEFGTWYLAQQLKRFQNNALFALAAYNGGGGNVLKWNKNDMSYDIDLFVEDIWLSETEAYVKIIYQNYEHYEDIYRR